SNNLGASLLTTGILSILPMLLVLLFFLPLISTLPLLHHINIDGFIVCPDGNAPKSVTVIVKDGDEDAELIRKVFSPAHEYCLGVDDFVDVKSSHPEVTVFAHCVTGDKDCIYQQTRSIPRSYIDNSIPFRPTFKAQAADLKTCRSA
ncbi:hypothetical protein PFISCL1PPCAC_5956, partial [Pristionchus fissidentatus]